LLHTFRNHDIVTVFDCRERRSGHNLSELNTINNEQMLSVATQLQQHCKKHRRQRGYSHSGQ